MPDSQIDFSDAPEVMPLPAEAEIGRFYRPIKHLVSIRLDADVLAWFRGMGRGYQWEINKALRRVMEEELRALNAKH